MAKLKTDFKRIGRSGPTVDGRIISPEALEQAAANYSKEIYTALIWPDHIRWFNMGTVEELRTEPNEEGGVDLFAVIAPNDIYLNANAAGQRLFTSMELTREFRDTGEHYLTGLAATDNPASAATSEMRFNVSERDTLYSEFTEHSLKPDDQPPGWFKKLFNKTNEDSMSQQQLAILAEKFNTLEAAVAKLTPPATEQTDTADSEQTQLTEKLSAISERLEALEANEQTQQAEQNDDFAKKFNQLLLDIKQLRTDFDAAVNQQDGTPPGEHQGDAVDLNDYI